MTRERREEVLLIALIASVAMHVVLIFTTRQMVMTRAFLGAAKVTRHASTMTSVKLSRPTAVEQFEDVAAIKDEPRAVAVESPSMASAVGRGASEVGSPKIELPQPKIAAPKEIASFDIAPIRLDSVVSEKLPAVKMSPVKFEVLAAPKAAPAKIIGALPKTQLMPLPSLDISRTPIGRSRRLSGNTVAPAPSEVFERVDEKIVEREKAAVRELMTDGNVLELQRHVKVSARSHVRDGWTYFKVVITPDGELSVVPKDVVVLIDASGSIGKDRIASIRSAAKRILRSATNTDDRFNLVAFRDRYSYAFRSWQPCSQRAFDQADRWLSNVAAHGRTDVFSTIRSVLTLPRDPRRPLIALVVTDGDANEGVEETSQILSKFTALNDGLISVYMYGVKASANRELIDVLTHGNRGESFIFNGMRWNAGSELEGLSDRFRDPVLSDIRLVFSSLTTAEAYPRRLRNLYRGESLEVIGRVPKDAKEVAFSVRGLHGGDAYEDFFRLPLSPSDSDSALVEEWLGERLIDDKLK